MILQLQKLTPLEFLQRIGVFIGLYVVIMLASIPVQFLVFLRPGMVGKTIITILHFASFGIAIGIAYAANRKYNNFKLAPLKRTHFKTIILSWLLFLLIEMVLGAASFWLYHTNQSANNKIIAQILGSSKLALILLGISSVFLSPILEELVFRQFLARSFFNRDAFWGPALLSALLFALPHMHDLNVISLMTYGSLGFILAAVFLKNDNIKVSIGLHFLNNLMAMLIMLTQIK